MAMAAAAASWWQTEIPLIYVAGTTWIGSCWCPWTTRATRREEGEAQAKRDCFPASFQEASSSRGTSRSCVPRMTSWPSLASHREETTDAESSLGSSAAREARTVA